VISFREFLVLTPFAFIGGAAIWLGCSGSAANWTAADTKSVSDAVRAEKALMQLCDSDAGCTRGQVAAVENATLCDLGAALERHGGDILDGGELARCKP
jgi:hypothetical protein